MNTTGQTDLSEPELDNKLFRKWRREFSLMTGYGIDPAERVFTINRRNCERWKRHLLNYNTSCVMSRSLVM
jgi:inner membrane protease ATP23